MIATLDDLDVEGTTVGVRVDVNSPIGDDGTLADDARLRAHVNTLSELLERDGRVAVLAHQGRPGSDDFVTLESPRRPPLGTARPPRRLRGRDLHRRRPRGR